MSSSTCGRPMSDFAPWREAAAQHGRLVYRAGSGELYEFDATSVHGVDLLDDGADPWLAWQSRTARCRGPAMLAKCRCRPGRPSVARIDVSGLRARTPVVLAVSHACAANTAIRVQINWLAQNGDIIRTDAVRSECGPSPSGGRLRADVPPKSPPRLCVFRQRWAERGTVVRRQNGSRHRWAVRDAALKTRSRADAGRSPRWIS